MKQQGRRLARVSVLVEKQDGTIEYRTWRTWGSIKKLHRKAREAIEAEIPGAKVSFGNAMCTNHYGGH